MKNNKGITLIALIVTIIVLIILAGVAIAMLSGDNGVLKNAEAARYDTSISAFKIDLGCETTLENNIFAYEGDYTLAWTTNMEEYHA